MREIKEKEIGSILDTAEVKILSEVIRKKNTLTRGPYQQKFEKMFAKVSGNKFAVSVSSCAAALKISSQLLKLKKNDEVLVQSNGFWKTISHLIEKKVRIKVVDTNTNNLQMNYDDLKSKITKKTKAVYLVSIGGDPGEIIKIYHLCKKNKIPLVHDAAHSTFFKIGNMSSGKFADINCFSFSTLKNMTTLGEGGMITTNDKTFFKNAQKLRDGWPIGNSIRKKNKPPFGGIKNKFLNPGDYYSHTWKTLEEIGSTFRMGDAQAAVGIVQLKKIEKMLNLRKTIASIYNNNLKKYEFIKLISFKKNVKPSHHLYSFLLTKNKYFNRDQLIRKLKKSYNVTIKNRYWPIHMHSILKMKGHKIGEAKNFEKIYFHEQVDLPISANMTIQEANELMSRFNRCINSFKKNKK